ncbi:serine hydrolase domain-containing protein [candidate division KSB1 bacterium]
MIEYQLYPKSIRTGYIVMFFFSILLLHCSGGPAFENDRQIASKLEPIINDYMVTYNLPGLAIGIVKDKKVVYANGFGLKSINSDDSVTSTTLFHMASISKPFVATAIMQLSEQGKIDINSPVTDYLPYFKLGDERYKSITIQQMLSHISGMPDVEDYEWDNPQYDDGAMERYVRSLSDRKMIFDPGEKFSYSNMAFEVLGDVIAKVSGTTFDDYEKEYILNPLGMKKSTFLKPEHLPEDWAAAHIMRQTTEAWDGYPYNRIHGPSSTLHSNVVEMCNWAIANMNSGELNGTRILNADSYDLLWKPLFTINSETNRSIGLSWFLAEYEGFKTVGHSGGDIGFNTNFVMIPEKSIAIVVLSNRMPAPVGDITNAALDILLGLEKEKAK